LTPEHKKRFFIERDATVSQLESLLKKEDKSYQSVVFRIGKDEVQDKSLPLFDSIINENLKIEVNRNVIPAEVDLNGQIAYLNYENYDAFMHEHEIPINDSLVMTNFVKLYTETLEKKFPNKQSYDPKQLQEAIGSTLQSFRIKNDKEVAQFEKIIDQLTTIHAEEKALYDSLIEQATANSNKIIKLAIAAMIAQWAILFYLTYYEVGWDVTEPIGYLIGLGIEGVALAFFVKYARNFEQRTVFNMIFEKQKRNLLRLKSTYPEAELEFINRRVKYMTQRILYARSA